MDIQISPTSKLDGSPSLPGDKSISHRAQLFGALALGRTEIHGLSDGEDVTSTRRCLGALGVRFERKGDSLFVDGVGLRGLRPCAERLDCGNSGSTIRMMMGILAGQAFASTLFGDTSLSRRPMKRVAEPLREMGARITMTEDIYPPLTVDGAGKLRAIAYHLKVASAQVKSAILFAGLYAEGTTRITGEIDSRDHTERLFPHFGGTIGVSKDALTVQGGQAFRAARVDVPGDPSSAAFWLAAACLVPGGRITIRNVLLNPTRTGFFQALKKMGARIDESVTATSPEPVGDVTASGGQLRGITIAKEDVASLIDELPMLAVLATYAEGATEVRGAEELRVKETDRIEAVAENLRRMGVKIETYPDGFRVEGPQRLRGAAVDSFHDHRIAMAFAIGAIGAVGDTTIRGAESVGISYPAFFETLAELRR